jgi:GT2 family glycosyltransferase
MDKPTVSVVIANWNGAEHLRLCLPSLLSQSYSPLEVIVVDNCSSDDSEAVAKSFGIRWFPLETNIGLAPALNRGAAVAVGHLLLFVNNDMRFDPGFVAKLVKPLDEDQKLFATDGMQFNWDGTVREHMASRLSRARRSPNSCTELVPGLHFYQQEEIHRSLVFMASAACMMVRRSVFETLGRFDDRLPLGYEDVEICWRGWVHGHKTLYVPDAICWHRVGSSQKSSEGSRLSFQGILKGRLLVATKLLPLRYALRTWLVSIAGLAKDLSRMRWRSAIDRVRVLFQMALLSRQLLRERRGMFRDANVSPEELLTSLLQLTVDNGSR